MLPPPDITGLLDDWGRGDPPALDRLLPLAYAELRRERNGHSVSVEARP